MSAKQQEHVRTCACSSEHGQDINKNDFPACLHLTGSGKWHATIDALLDGMAAVYMSNSMDALRSPSVSFLWAAVKSAVVEGALHHV